ncbi:hypothetical protein [Cellulomonas phragmiteti]|uniref:Uncharacterized protein n=1 Tax=Cellulomonas phragmiteti TaxID=478780 RepID=A0ABQ4DIT1_9CELL|nr:hypothetical protein [Cellulomonas phragmiteti]GIG39263.1 hypothetical protein Cph01nite_10250 [Cellulomonas phragmiteti]
MRITRKIAAAGAAGALTVACVAALAAPSSAATAPDGTVSTRAAAIVEALSGLVEDGTLTSSQADEVATTLEGSDALRGGRGHGGGHHLDLTAAATALGMTSDELRTALDVEGTTLADVAAAQGVPTSALVDALVEARTERLQEKVAEGDLTQAEADEKIAALPERVAALVEEARPGRSGRGPRSEGSGDASGASTDGSAVTPAA